MIRISHLSLRIKLDDILKNINIEQKILENIRRASKIVGNQFKIIFWNENLTEEECKEFVKRNEKLLFEVNTKITKNYGNAWFVVDGSGKDKCKHRYKYTGDILTGIVNYVNIVKTMRKMEI